MDRWRFTEENNLEIQRALEILKEYPNRIQSVIVGNEVLLRKELEPLELYAYIDFMKSHTKKTCNNCRNLGYLGKKKSATS